MGIRLTSDVGSPLVVAAVNIVGRTTIPDYHDWAIYGMTALGYIGGWMGWGGDFVKQIGVASLPLTVDKIYERMKGGVGSRSRVFRSASVSRYPAPATKTPYEGVRLV